MSYWEVGAEYEDTGKGNRIVTFGYIKGDLVYDSDDYAIAIVGDPLYEKRYRRVENYSAVPEEWN